MYLEFTEYWRWRSNYVAYFFLYFVSFYSVVLCFETIKVWDGKVSRDILWHLFFFFSFCQLSIGMCALCVQISLFAQSPPWWENYARRLWLMSVEQTRSVTQQHFKERRNRDARPAKKLRGINESLAKWRTSLRIVKRKNITYVVRISKLWDDIRCDVCRMIFFFGSSYRWGRSSVRTIPMPTLRIKFHIAILRMSYSFRLSLPLFYYNYYNASNVVLTESVPNVRYFRLGMYCSFFVIFFWTEIRLWALFGRHRVSKFTK